VADDLRVLDYLFASRLHESLHLSTRQYAHIVDSWVEEIGLDSANYGTHSMRRTKASLIYRRTKNLREVELLLGHTKLESTVQFGLPGGPGFEPRLTESESLLSH
jgi:integrase